MLHYLEILRPVNGLMSAFAVFIGALVAGGSLTTDVYIGMLSVFLSSGAGMVINDYYDVEIDRMNKPNRPIPSGKIREQTALMYSAGLFLAGIYLAYLINIETTITAAIASLLLIVYASHFKKTLLLGNVLVSAMVALTFIFGGMIFNNWVLLLPVAMLAFLSNMAREIYKTIDDSLGDQKYEVNSVALRLGVTHARLLANIFTISAVVFSFLPYFLGIFGQTYLFFVIIADIAFIASVVTPAKYGSKLLKIGMFIALLSFLAGSVSP
jgi:geranylgeranylglycerol-phosphate geranylgeranyltransferase